MASRFVDGARARLFDDRFPGAMWSRLFRQLVETCILLGNPFRISIDDSFTGHSTERLALMVDNVFSRFYSVLDCLGQNSW
jgi:hypothetical protein